MKSKDLDRIFDGRTKEIKELSKEVFDANNKNNTMHRKSFNVTGTWDSTYYNYTFTLPDAVKQFLLDNVELERIYSIVFGVYINGNTSTMCYVNSDVYVTTQSGSTIFAGISNPCSIIKSTDHLMRFGFSSSLNLTLYLNTTTEPTDITSINAVIAIIY